MEILNFILSTEDKKNKSKIWKQKQIWSAEKYGRIVKTKIHQVYGEKKMNTEINLTSENNGWIMKTK